MFAGRNMPKSRSNGTDTATLPTYGRFLQTDPLGYGDGMNMYAYVGNDPVNATDPSGLKGNKPKQPPPPPGGTSIDRGWWRCYGNCGGGYANDAMNGTWTFNPGINSQPGFDENGKPALVVMPSSWKFVPNNARLTVWQPEYIRTPVRTEATPYPEPEPTNELMTICDVGSAGPGTAGPCVTQTKQEWCEGADAADRSLSEVSYIATGLSFLPRIPMPRYVTAGIWGARGHQKLIKLRACE